MLPSVSPFTLTVITGIVLLCLYWIYRFVYAPFQLFKQLGIKGPAPLPFYGNFKARSQLGLVKFIESVYEEYGPIAGFYLGKTPVLMIADLDILKQILVKEFDSFMDRPPFPDLIRQKNAPRGLLTSRGETWKISRQTLSPSFSASKMKMMVPLIQNSTEVLSLKMGEIADSGQSKDIFKVFGAFTMETIVAIAFGRVIDIQGGENDSLTNAASMMFRSSEETNKTSLTFILPLLSEIAEGNFPFLEGILRIIVSRSKRGYAMMTLQETALNLVKARRESGHQGKFKDLLQLMLEASVSEEEGKEPCPVGDKKLSDKQIVSHSVTFLLAGYETTANTLAYTAYLLALNPDIQEKLQKEIDNYMKENPDTDLYEASQNITYLEMVIEESLRLYCPAPVTNRYCRKTVTINGLTIPEGVTTLVPIYTLHRNPLYWKDPEKFDPERFTPEEKAKRPQLCYLPFGFGPRNCIGMRFAMLEAKLALMKVLSKYTFVQSADTEVPLQTVVGITMAPKNGIYLKIVPRN